MSVPLPPIQSSTSDRVASSLDFAQSFGGLDKSTNGLGTTQMIVGGLVVVGITFLLTRRAN